MTIEEFGSPEQMKGVRKLFESDWSEWYVGALEDSGIFMTPAELAISKEQAWKSWISGECVEINFPA